MTEKLSPAAAGAELWQLAEAGWPRLLELLSPARSAGPLPLPHMSAITVALAADAVAFFAAAELFLRDGREFLLLGITSDVACAADQSKFSEAVFFVATDGAGAVVMVAFRTRADYKFLASRTTNDAAPAALASAIRERCADSPPTGILAPAGSSEAVAEQLAECFGTGPPTVGMRERYLAATAARDPPHGIPEGSMRPVDNDADGALLGGWMEAFEASTQAMCPML